MRLFAKVLGVAVVLALLCLGGLALWGQRLEELFSQERCIDWFSQIRSVAWLVAIGLLVSDLVLPIPATGVMAALGCIYGVGLGAAIGATGSALSGMMGYGLARLAGLRGTRLIARPDEVGRFRAFFDRWGGAGIIASRFLPILPEVMSVLAGLAGMGVVRFVGALLLGTIPAALLYAAVGRVSSEAPWLGIALAAGVPLALWPVFLWIVGRAGDRPGASEGEPPPRRP